MSDTHEASVKLDESRLASEIALQAFYASEHGRPLFIIVNYDHEADKISFLAKLKKKIIEKGLSTRPLSYASNNEKDILRVYDLIQEAAKEKSIAVLTDLPRQGSKLSPDFLYFINLHRDRIARQNLRFVLFLHSSDAETFINSAGDLWDFRDRTYWLERVVYTEKNTFWQHIDEKCSDINVPEADSKEISDHIAIVKKIVEETSAPEEKAALLFDLSRWLQRKHSYDLALEAALEGIRIISDKRTLLMAKLKNFAGYILNLKGNFHEALKYYEESLAISREFGDRQAEGVILNNIAGVYHVWSKNDEALKSYEEYLAITRELENRQGECVALNNISQIYHAGGKYDEALNVLQESLVIKRELGDSQGEAVALNNISMIYYVWGRYDEALKFFEESLTISREIGDRRGEGLTLNNISQIYMAWGRHDEALRVLEESLVIARELGDRKNEGVALNNVSQIYRAWGRYDEALKGYEQSLSIRRELGDRQGEGITLNNISRIYDACGRYEEALNVLEESLTISREIGDRKVEGIICGHIGIEYERRGDLCKAIDYIRRSVKIKQELSSSGYQSSLGYLKKLEEKAGEQTQPLDL